MNGQFDFGSLSPGRYFFSIALILGLLFGFITPLEDDESRLLVLLQWLLQSLIPMGIMVCSHITLHRVATFDRLNPWAKLCFSGLLASLCYSPIALLIDQWLEHETGANLFLEVLDEWSAVAPPIILTWLAINAPWVLGYSLNRTNPLVQPLSAERAAHQEADDEKGSTIGADNRAQRSETKPDSKNSSLWSLVSRDLGRDVIYIKAELHYIQVVTTKGKELILYNLKDATADLPSELGCSSHRSYWVAYGHIHKLEKEGRQGKLLMTNGDIVPVSRQRMSDLVAALE